MEKHWNKVYENAWGEYASNYGAVTSGFKIKGSPTMTG